MSTPTIHPRVDFDHWASLFPLEAFQKSKPASERTVGTPDWTAEGKMITSPGHLCNIELVRQYHSRSQDLGPSVPVDLFLWSTIPHQQPYLTRLGGVPHRESKKAWPRHGRKPYTFVAQFCFADSRDIVSNKLPGDVMLVYFLDHELSHDAEAIHIEWSSMKLQSPMTAAQVPRPAFTVPQLWGHIYRTAEYPESGEIFYDAGHDGSYLFPTTQSTKIGRETFFIQDDPHEDSQELLCTLNSVFPAFHGPCTRWPFIGLESLPEGRESSLYRPAPKKFPWFDPRSWLPKRKDSSGNHPGWGPYEMVFDDLGCIYFLIDEDGRVTWSWDSY